MHRRIIVPYFVRDILARSRYEYKHFTDDPRFAPGYTITIVSDEYYETPAGAALGKAKLLLAIKRLCHWANTHGSFGTANIICGPVLTPFNNLSATVTILDPVMRHLEPFIPSGGIRFKEIFNEDDGYEEPEDDEEEDTEGEKDWDDFIDFLAFFDDIDDDDDDDEEEEDDADPDGEDAAGEDADGEDTKTANDDAPASEEGPENPAADSAENSEQADKA